MVTNILFIVLTLFSIFCGIKFGYVDSHTPPAAFIISILLLILGLILTIFRKNLFENKINLRIHIIVVCINLLIVLFYLSPIFI